MASALAVALSFTGCREKAATSDSGNLPTAQVRIFTVEAKPHVGTEDVVGTVNPKLSSVIEAKVSARIEQMLVTSGQYVKANELLAQLDAGEIKARLDQATAVREQTESDLKRYTDLVAKQAVTKQDFEAIQSKARVAKAAVDEAETTLGYTKIVAPFDGVVTRKLADVGDLASPGKPLLEIEDPKLLRFEAAVPEGIIGRVEPGAKLPVRVGELKIEGTVGEMAPTADPSSRTFMVKLDLPATPGLRTGQFGRVSVPVSETSVLRVPSSAIVERGQMELLFVAEGNRVLLRLVKTGKRIGDETEVLSGVDAGERVVAEAAGSLVDGQPIEVKP